MAEAATTELGPGGGSGDDVARATSQFEDVHTPSTYRYGSLAHTNLRLLHEVDSAFAAGSTSYQAMKGTLGQKVGPPLFEMFKESIQGRLQLLHSRSAPPLAPLQQYSSSSNNSIDSMDLGWPLAPPPLGMATPQDDATNGERENDDNSNSSDEQPDPVVDATADLVLRLSGARSRMHVIDMLFASNHLLHGIEMPALGYVPMKQIQKDLLREEFVIDGSIFQSHLQTRHVALSSPRSGGGVSGGRSVDSIATGFEVLEGRLLDLLASAACDRETSPLPPLSSGEPHFADAEAVAWAVQAMSRTIHGGDSFFHMHALFKSVDMVLTPCGEQVQQSEHKTSISVVPVNATGLVTVPATSNTADADANADVGSATTPEPRPEFLLEIITHNLYDLQPSGEMGTRGGDETTDSGIDRGVWLRVDVVISHYRNLMTGKCHRTMDIESRVRVHACVLSVRVRARG